jgi:hypothetical protein
VSNIIGRPVYADQYFGGSNFTSGEFEPYFQDTGVTPDYVDAKGKYYTAGELVYVEFAVYFTNVTNFGSGQYNIILPYESATHCSISGGSVHDASLGHTYTLKGEVDPNSKEMLLFTVGSSTRDAAFTHNTPFNLATDDYVHFQGWYRRAVS